MNPKTTTTSAKFGQVNLTVTQGDHLCAEGEATVRGQTKHYHAHLHLWWPDGKWHVGGQGQNASDRKRQCYISGGTEAFVVAVIAELEIVVNAWAATPEAPGLIATAAEEYKQLCIANRLKEAVKHEAAAKVLRDEARRIKLGDEVLSLYSEAIPANYDITHDAAVAIAAIKADIPAGSDYEEGSFYVGTSHDREFPGIISGPFKSEPALLAGYVLYTRKNGKWLSH